MEQMIFEKDKILAANKSLQRQIKAIKEILKIQGIASNCKISMIEDIVRGDEE